MSLPRLLLPELPHCLKCHPLPLIPELIDNMKESTLFIKFDICWGYNNIRIREEDQWKAAFITPMGLFEPTVMFFGFCNAPPTFQAFMNHIFTDMLPEKWLKIFYRKFIPDFSNIVAPLNLLTRKGEPWIWTQLQQRAFERLKHIFSSAPVLQIPDVTHPFSIMTDASLLAAGAVLMQADENSDLHPCTYFSCTFSSTQHNYDIYDCELLAVILALEEWHQYLQGTAHPITIITDHKNLSYIKDPRKLSR